MSSDEGGIEEAGGASLVAPLARKMALTRTASSGDLTRNSFAEMARELQEARAQIWDQLALTTKMTRDMDDRIMDDRSTPDEVQGQQRRVDKLVCQLSAGHFDMHTDLTEIMQSYRDGLLTADQIESMILEEKDRGEFIIKIAVAMKAQLESIFQSYANIADKVELGEHIDSASINGIFLDFNEAINTVRYIGQVAQTPTPKLRSTIAGMRAHIDTAMLQTLQPHESRIQLSAQTPTSPDPPQTSLPLPRNHPPPLGKGGEGAAASMESSNSRVRVKMDDNMDNRVNDDEQSITSVRSVSISRAQIRADAEAQTDLGVDEMRVLLAAPTTSGSIDMTSSVDAGLETAESLEQRIGSLRMVGKKAVRLDRKAAEKVQAALAAALLATQKQQAQLAEQQAELVERRAALDLRTGDLLNMARKVTRYERVTQGRIELIAEEVDRRVALVLNSGVTMSLRHPDDPSPGEAGCEEGKSSCSVGRLGGGADFGGGVGHESTTTQSFIELGLEAALAAQAQTMANDLAEESALGLSPAAGQFGPEGAGAEALHQELQNMATLFVKGDKMLGLENRPRSQNHARLRSGHHHGAAHDIPDVDDDLSSVGGASHATPGRPGRYDHKRISSSGPGMEGSYADIPMPHGTLPYGAIEVPPPHTQQRGVPRSQVELVVIFPPSQESQQTDTDDFKEYLFGTGPFAPQITGQAVSVAPGRGAGKKKVASVKVPGSPRAIELSLTGTVSGIFMDDSEDEGSPRKAASRKASLRLSREATRESRGLRGMGEKDQDDDEAESSLASNTASIMSVSKMGVFVNYDARDIAHGGAQHHEATAKAPRPARDTASDGGLPIVSSSAMGLTTRTYNPRPALDVYRELLEAENPLLTLMEVYGECLPEAHYALLAEAAAGSGLGRSIGCVERMFAPLVLPLRRIDAATHNCLKELRACEELSSSLIVLVGSGEVPMDVYKRSLAQLFHQISDVDSIRLWVEIQLVSYRAIFDRINALKIDMLADLSAQSGAFKETFEFFVSCQSRVVRSKWIRCKPTSHNTVNYLV